MSSQAFGEYLESVRACSEARRWVGGRSLEEAWAECPRGDWLLWLAGRSGVDRRVVVAAACAVARTALVHVPAGEMRPLRAIETAEAWCRGEVPLEDVGRAYAAAYAADAAAAYAADAAAAYAAADAAADAAAYAAAYADADAYAAAADAAYAAADAAAYADAADAAARGGALQAAADIVRRLISVETVRAAVHRRGMAA